MAESFSGRFVREHAGLVAAGWRALSDLTLAGLLEAPAMAEMDKRAPLWGFSNVGKLELRAMERLAVAPW